MTTAAENVVPVEATPVPPTPTQESPAEALKRIDRIIQDTAGELVERVRASENMDDLVFQGDLSREDIQEQFTVIISGDENYAQLRQLVGAINLKYNRATWYLLNSDAALRRANQTLDLAKSKYNRDLVLANTTSRRNDKISDKSREELVGQIYTLQGVADELGALETEAAIWKQVVKDLDKAFERVQQNMQALASEHKYTGANEGARVPR